MPFASVICWKVFDKLGLVVRPDIDVGQIFTKWAVRETFLLYWKSQRETGILLLK